MTTAQRVATVGVALLLAAAAVFVFLVLRGGSDTPEFGAFTDTTTTATTVADAETTATTAEPDDPTTTSTVTATTTATTAEPDEPATTSTVTATTVTDPDTDEGAATATTTATTVPAVTVPVPDEPDEWWAYDPELEWPVTDRDRLATDDVYPDGMIPAAVNVAKQVEAFWAWYMTWGHPQGAALDLTLPEHGEWLGGDAVGQLMYIHHRFWQQRLPAWEEVWNREFDQAREQQRNKLIYLDSLGDLAHWGEGWPTLVYNPADETTVWRYWGPIIRPAPDPTAPRRSGTPILPDDLGGACGPESASPESILLIVSWDCVHLGPAEETALGDWDASSWYDIPHEHAAWYVYTTDVVVRYDPDVHGAPTSRFGVADGWLMYLPATVPDGAGLADIVEAWKPWRPEGFPHDPDAFQQMWRHDVGGNSFWHKEMGQLVLLVPVDELVAWLETNGHDPQGMFAAGWPNPDEERLIRNTWAKDWDRDNPDDWRNKFADAVGWLEQGVEIGDGGNLAADIEAAIHISAWLDWAYRARLSPSPFPSDQRTRGWSPSVWAPGGVGTGSVAELADAVFGHRPDGWATSNGAWAGLYHQALADGYGVGAETGRLTHPALNPELAVWQEWAAAGEAEKWLGFQAAGGDLGPAPGDTWIPWYPETLVPLEDHYVLPEGAVGHWETVVDWWPDGGLEPPVHQPDWYHAFTVAGPYVADTGGHLFETCLWATGGLFAAWSLPHPELEDASQNVTWVVRGIADRDGRVVTLAEPVNRPCINAVNRWQHEGNIPRAVGGRASFEQHLEYLRTPIREPVMNHGYDRATGVWTTADGYRVAVPSRLLADGHISNHELDWIEAVAAAASGPDGPGNVLEPSYGDWQQWETDALAAARIDYGEGGLPLRHHRLWPSEWETIRREEAEYAADAFNQHVRGAELDTPARYGDWLTGAPRSWPEEFMRSTYRIVSRHRQPGSMHWLYNDGTAIDVDSWALPASEWERWAERREAETLHTGVLITPLFVRHWETEGTIAAGNIGTHTHSDWSWANVEMLDGYVKAEGGIVGSDGVVIEGSPPWTVYLTSCLEEGFPAFASRDGWGEGACSPGSLPKRPTVPYGHGPGCCPPAPTSSDRKTLPGPAGRGGPGRTIPTSPCPTRCGAASCHPSTARV